MPEIIRDRAARGARRLTVGRTDAWTVTEESASGRGKGSCLRRAFLRRAACPDAHRDRFPKNRPPIPYPTSTYAHSRRIGDRLTLSRPDPIAMYIGIGAAWRVVVGACGRWRGALDHRRKGRTPIAECSCSVRGSGADRGAGRVTLPPPHIAGSLFARGSR